MKTVFTLLEKEWKLFFRDKRGLISIFLFTALVTLLLFFGLGHLGIAPQNAVPLVIWLSTLFGGTLQLNRTFDYEREEAVMEGLKMIPGIAGKIYLSKFIVNTITLFLVFIFATLLASLLFNYSGSLNFVLPIALGAISMSAIGTTFSSMFMTHHKKDIMLPTLFYPLIAPIVIAVIKASDITTPDIGAWLKIIIVFNILYITISYLVFEHIIEE
jgi:heme exporter protein B